MYVLVANDRERINSVETIRDTMGKPEGGRAHAAH